MLSSQIRRIMAPNLFFALCLLAITAIAAARVGPLTDHFIMLPSESEEYTVGTRWAILVAGSAGYGNYRHQADVCHAYQVLKRGGLKDENIVVFMFDDIASHPSNPYPGKIFNRPGGSDVYDGVPKDYTGKDVTVDNLLAVILGNKTAVTGGSGKVVESGPDDHIFIFYADHGGPGVLGMPTFPYLYANDLIDVFKLKHSSRTYKEMVIYVEACESGSVFDGLLPDDLNIYVTTASNPDESSWATYCPSTFPPAPPEFHTCLGDLYSVSWMEDSEGHNLKEETLNQQYEIVRFRTSNHNTYITGSHVMKYGDVKADTEEVYTYLGSDPANDNIQSLSNETFTKDFRLFAKVEKYTGVEQRDADLLYLWMKYQMANEGSGERIEAQVDLIKEMEKRMRLDKRVELLGKLLFGSKRGPSLLKAVRPPGQPLVDDWVCLKAVVAKFESECGSLGQYGMKHIRAFANICNAGVDANRVAAESADACDHNGLMSESWSSVERSLINLFGYQKHATPGTQLLSSGQGDVTTIGDLVFTISQHLIANDVNI